MLKRRGVALEKCPDNDGVSLRPETLLRAPGFRTIRMQGSCISERRPVLGNIGLIKSVPWISKTGSEEALLISALLWESCRWDFLCSSDTVLFGQNPDSVLVVQGRNCRKQLNEGPAV